MSPTVLGKSFGCIILCCVAAAAGAACVKLPRRAASQRLHAAQTTRPAESSATPVNVNPININEASREELERLPGIGPALAERIVEHRERHGRFRRAEHLMLVRGISERRFRQLRAHVTPE